MSAGQTGTAPSTTCHQFHVRSDLRLHEVIYVLLYTEAHKLRRLDSVFNVRKSCMLRMERRHKLLSQTLLFLLQLSSEHVSGAGTPSGSGKWSGAGPKNTMSRIGAWKNRPTVER